jgi:hypothetical protein
MHYNEFVNKIQQNYWNSFFFFSPNLGRLIFAL